MIIKIEKTPINRSIVVIKIPTTPINAGFVGLMLKMLRINIERKNEIIKHPKAVMIAVVELPFLF